MSPELRDRLKRLGVHKGATRLKPSCIDPFVRDGAPAESPHRPPQPGSDTPRQSLWDILQETAYGLAFIRRTRYPLDQIHGGYSLGQALATAEQLSLSRLVGPPDLRDAVFLDTETTGLAGGAGTLAFLVGVGYFETDHEQQTTGNRRHADGQHQAGSVTSAVAVVRPTSFVVDQYFLPDPVNEEGLLCALDERISRHSGLVTFNGRGFDVPLLQTRYALARIPPALTGMPNLDLLAPSRRIWRSALASCSLGSLEYHVLDVHRDQQDIPGALIPQLYREYLQTGIAGDMERVMYHNAIDILSMVTLAARIAEAFSRPSAPAEYLSAAAHYERVGEVNRAVEAYRAVLSLTGNPAELNALALRRLAGCLRRQNRRADALSCWQELAEQGDAQALVELAKHYEWHAVDLARAHACASRALALVRDEPLRAEIQHRIDRLNRKMNPPARA